jgi:hypothetical protein
MSNVSTIVKAVESLKKALGDIVVNTILEKAGTKVYDTATGKATDTTTSPTIDIAITQFDFKEIDGTNVRSDDLKGVVFDTDKDIDTDDRIQYNTVSYKIINSKPIYAGATLVATEVQLRK